MSYGKYIREHFHWLVIFLLIALTLEAFLLIFPGSGWLMRYVAVILGLGFLLGTGLEYFKEKRYFERCEKALVQLDKEYLFPEMLQDTGCQEEKEIREILRLMESGMTREVSNFRRNSEEYKEYIETWVHEIKIPIATAKMILTNRKAEDGGLSTEIEKIENYVEQALFYARSTEVEKDYFIKPVDLEMLLNDVIRQKKRMLIARKASVDIHDLENEKEILSDGKWLSFIIGQIVDNAIKYSKEDKVFLEVFCEEVWEEEKKEVFSAWQTEEKANKEKRDIEKANKEKIDTENANKVKGNIEIIDEDKIGGIRSEEGFKTRDVSLCRGEKKRICLVIRDRGMGMKASEVDRVFDKGFTGSNGRNGKASTGIGLYLCKKLCERLEHEISLTSVEGEGTEVRIVF